MFAAMSLSLKESAAKLEAILQDIYQNESGVPSSENLIAFETLAKHLRSSSRQRKKAWCLLEWLLSTKKLVVIPISPGF